MTDLDKVSRYDGGQGGGMVGDPHGMYVHVADFDACHAELIATLRALDNLHKGWGFDIEFLLDVARTELAQEAAQGSAE